MKALITANFTAWGIKQLERYMEVIYQPWTETNKIILSDQMAEKLKQLGADILILEVDLCHEEVFEQVDLKLVGVCRGDPLNVDVELATEKGVPVLYTPGRNAQAVADLTLGFMLCLARKIVPIHNLLVQGKYNPEDYKEYMEWYKQMTGMELAGKIVGIIGLGAIGRQVAKRLAGFDARIWAYDPFVPEEVFNRFQAERKSLEEIFSKADFITLHLPLNDETEGIITRQLLERIKPGAYFLNLARAELVDNQALLELLREKKIAGAGIDVFLDEPPEPDNPFFQLDNVVVTPHIGGATKEVVEHQTEMLVRDILAWLEGKKPRYILNPQVLEAG